MYNCEFEIDPTDQEKREAILGPKLSEPKTVIVVLEFTATEYQAVSKPQAYMEELIGLVPKTALKVKGVGRVTGAIPKQ